MATRALGARCLSRLVSVQPRVAWKRPGAIAASAARGIVNAESMGTVVQVSKQMHWTSFMYGRERQLLVHVVSSAQEGDVDSVLDAMDSFWAHQFGMKGTDSWSIRADMLDRLVLEKAPTRCLELGTYCGYSALRIARNLPKDGLLVSIEVDPLFGAIATKIVEYAGLGGKVKILSGTVESKLKRIHQLCGQGPDMESERFDFVLCDHSKDRFVPDLEILERAGLAGPGTVVMGDTTFYPGEEAADEGAGQTLLSYMATSQKFKVEKHVSTEQSAGITVCEWQHLV